MKLEISVTAENINRGDLISKIDDAIEEETTDVTSINISFTECDKEED